MELINTLVLDSAGSCSNDSDDTLLQMTENITAMRSTVRAVNTDQMVKPTIMHAQTAL